MLNPVSRWLITAGLVAMVLWPRYFFVSVAGKGVSLYTVSTIVLLLAAFATFAVQADIRRLAADGIARAPFQVGLFALFWIWRIATDLMGLTPTDSLFVTLLDFVYLGSWFVIGLVFFVDLRMQVRLQYIMLVCCIIVTFIGAIEFATRMSVADIFGFNSILAGDSYKNAAVTSVKYRNEVQKVQSVFSHPIVYGEVVAGMLPIAFHFLLRGGILRKMLGVVFVSAIAMSAVLSNVRSPLFVAISSASVYCAIALFDIRKWTGFLMAGWALIAVVVVAPITAGQLSTVAEGRNADEAASSVARTRQYAQGTAALQTRPLNGYGDGNSLAVAGIPTLDGRSRTIDNYYLSIAVDNGYIGLALFVTMVISFIFRGVMLTYRDVSPLSKSMVGSYTGMLVGMLVGLIILSINDTLSYIYMAGGFIVARTATAARLNNLRARSQLGEATAANRPARKGPRQIINL